MIALLAAADAAGVAYVSWKNNHELSLALSGSSDLDVFVPLADRPAFLELARQQRWAAAENPVARFPWVTHLYHPGGHHLHVYFRVVTGESWLKEYVLPLDDYLIANRVRSPEHGVWVLAPAAQAHLFVVRHLLKGGSPASRWLYRRELESYRAEWQQCSGSQEDGGPLPLDGYRLPSDGLTLPSWRDARAFRRRLRGYLRVRGGMLPLLRALAFVRRLLTPAALRGKKCLAGRGLVVAVSGVDGAGKSTLLAELHAAFSATYRVARIGLGRPQGQVLETARKAGKRASRRGTTLRALVLAYARLERARQATRLARAGWLVLADRWPTAAQGMMDGPRTDSPTEHRLYAALPPADLCVFLEVPVAAALARNQGRDKVDKESDAEIIARFERNCDFAPLARRVVRFDNDGPLAEKRVQMLDLVTDAVVERSHARRVIEFYGAPGAGKTHRARATVADSAGTVSINASGAATRVAQKLAAITRVLVGWPRVVARVDDVLAQFEFARPTDRIRVRLNWLYVCGQLLRETGVVVLDQGLFQAVWSTRFRAPLVSSPEMVAQALAALIVELDLPRLDAVEVVADEATLRARLTARDGKSPLDRDFDRAWPHAQAATATVRAVHAAMAGAA